MNTRISCPVDGCTWSHTPGERAVDQNTLAPVFGPGVYATVAADQALQATERVIRIHMDTHTPVEFLHTITRLNGLVDQLAQVVDSLEATR